MATPSYVGQVGGAYVGGSVTSFTMSTSTSVAVGNVCFVAARGQAGARATSVTDSVGNTYRLVTQTTSGATASLYAARVTVAMPTSTVITVTQSASQPNSHAYAFVFRNLSMIGQGSGNTANTVTSITSNSITPNQVDGIIISVGSNNGQAKPTTSTSGFTTLSLTSAADNWTSVAWKQMSSTTMTSTSVLWNIGVTANTSALIATLNATSGEFLSLF